MADGATTKKASYTSEERIGVLEELLNERFSVRAFLPQPVPRETIARVLAVARRTASWCNSQPWQVIIASGEAKERFRKAIYAEAGSGAPEGLGTQELQLPCVRNNEVTVWSRVRMKPT